jgi:hypothetical protein
MPTKKTARPLSELMRQVMIDIDEGRGGFHGCSGRSEHGGRNGTLAGLAKRGLIDHQDALTAAGAEWVAQERARQRRPEADWSQAPEGTTHVMRSPGSQQVAWIKIEGNGPGETFWRWPGARNWRPSTDTASMVLSKASVEPRPVVSTPPESRMAFDLEAPARDPVRPEDVGAIMRIAHASGVDFTTNPGESCLAMNQVLFKNKGEVWAGVNEFFVLEELYIGKFVVRVDGLVAGDTFLVDVNGEFVTMDQLLDCGVLKAEVANAIIKTMKLDVVPTETDLTTPTIIDFAGINEPLLYNAAENDLAKKVGALALAVA